MRHQDFNIIFQQETTSAGLCNYFLSVALNRRLTLRILTNMYNTSKLALCVYSELNHFWPTSQPTSSLDPRSTSRGFGPFDFLTSGRVAQRKAKLLPYMQSPGVIYQNICSWKKVYMYSKFATLEYRLSSNYSTTLIEAPGSQNNFYIWVPSKFWNYFCWCLIPSLF